MSLGSVLEFAGSVGVGQRVADTIRTKVVKLDLFKDDPTVLMLGMTCAVVASSVYLTICTKIGLPVSTTHSIMGGVIGMGVATVGAQNIIWYDPKGDVASGVVSVFLAWVIAPGIAGAFGAIIFTITKFVVMLRSRPVMMGLITVPFYFGMTASLLTMLICWKGGSIDLDDWTNGQLAGLIVGVGVAWAVLVAVFLVPWLYRLVAKNDWELRWYHVFQGPLLLRRPEPSVQPEGAAGGIRDFYEGHLTKEELEAQRNTHSQDVEAGVAVAGGGDDSKEGRQIGHDDSESGSQVANNNDNNNNNSSSSSSNSTDSATATTTTPNNSSNSNSSSGVVHRGAKGTYKHRQLVGPRPEGKLLSGPVLYWMLKKVFLSGVDQDIVNMQKEESFLTGDLEKIHAGVPHYDNRAEYLYSFMQVMTACTASFTHGANDVANAIGPFATIFNIWQSGAISGSKSEVPVWILCFGGASIALGIWTYGYNIMRNLGNRITLHSPSRGFAMELGAACTIILATRLKLPVSTTQCITGATVGVGLCSGTWRTINWRMVAWIYMGWIITLPVAGIFAGCLTGLIINAPRWGYSG